MSNISTDSIYPRNRAFVGVQNLFTSGATTLGGDISADGTLAVAGDSTIGGDLYADGTLSLGGDSTIGGDLYADGTLDVVGNSTMGGTMNVAGATTVAGAATLASTLAVTGNSTMGGTLNITGVTTIAGATTLASTLAVTGNSTVGGTLTMVGAVYLPTATGTASAFNYYEETSVTADVSGGMVEAAALVITMRRIGKVVTLTWADHTTASSANVTITSSAAIPARFCPAADTYGSCLVWDSGAIVAGTAKVTAAGVVSFYVGAATAFTHPSNVGWMTCGMTYCVA